jgi:hypothetical protein
MVNFNRIKKYRADRKGQSLVEVAVFGSFLLLVLGFLLNQGLQYNYQQEAKMEAFRRSLLTASGSSIPKPHSVQVIKDVHFPDPSDMFAMGERNAIRGTAEVFWNNNSNELDYQTPATSSSAQYVFNPDSPLVAPVYQNYTTAALDIWPAGIITGRNATLNGVTEVYRVGGPASTRVYQAQPGFGSKQVMVLMDTYIPDCEEEYCEKDILGSVEFGGRFGGKQYWPVFNVTQGEVGAPPQVIAFLNKDAGQINETLANQQVVNKVIEKNRSLTLTEDANTRTSIEALHSNEHIKHVIMTQSGDQGPTFVFPDAEPAKTWTTPK